MKSLFFIIVIVLPLLMQSRPAFTIGSNGTAYNDRPVVFKDANYRGNYINITRCIPNLHDNGFGFGDNISSCIVPPGWKLVFYEHSNYCGASFTVGGYVSDFQNYSWNDCVSSVDVYYKGTLQGYSYTCPERRNEPVKVQKRDHPKS